MVTGFLLRVSGNNTVVPEKGLDGSSYEMPTIGHSFIFFDNSNVVRTSKVTEVEEQKPGFYQFKTSSGSVYTFQRSES